MLVFWLKLVKKHRNKDKWNCSNTSGVFNSVTAFMITTMMHNGLKCLTMKSNGFERYWDTHQPNADCEHCILSTRISVCNCSMLQITHRVNGIISKLSHCLTQRTNTWWATCIKVDVVYGPWMIRGKTILKVTLIRYWRITVLLNRRFISDHV